jgi:hypothetical protein
MLRVVFYSYSMGAQSSKHYDDEISYKEREEMLKPKGQILLTEEMWEHLLKSTESKKMEEAANREALLRRENAENDDYPIEEFSANTVKKIRPPIVQDPIIQPRDVAKMTESSHQQPSLIEPYEPLQLPAIPDLSIDPPLAVAKVCVDQEQSAKQCTSEKTLVDCRLEIDQFLKCTKNAVIERLSSYS